MNTINMKDLRAVLCIGAHADDIEIGCGATVLSLIEANPKLSVVWAVLSCGGEREAEARASASRFLQGAGTPRVEVSGFRDGYFPYQADIKEHFEFLKEICTPDLILTHRRDDRHQDHRTVCDLTWNTFRDHLILEYEIPKWDGDMGRPNVYVPLRKSVSDRKITYLMDSFASQRSKHWYDPELFRGLMRIRGMECVAPDFHAEAFWGNKILLSF